MRRTLFALTLLACSCGSAAWAAGAAPPGPAPPLAARAAAGDGAALDSLVKAVLSAQPPGRSYRTADNPALRRALVAGSRSLLAADPDVANLAGAAPVEAVAPVVLRRGIPSLCGLRVPDDLARRIASRNARARLIAATSPPPQRAPAVLPAKYDWRDRSVVKEVDDQGNCGSCWCFATAGSFESAYAIRNGQLKNFSKQFILDVAASVDGYTCDDGWWAFDVAERPGVPLTSEFPYQGSVGRTPDPGRFSKLFAAANWGYVGDSSGVPPVAQIKAAMMTHGPIAVGVLATNEFMAYSGGVFSERVPANQINHAVGLIGWDDGVGGGVWILRNSWSLQWGENGFMQIAYASSNVGFGAAWVDAMADQPSPQPNPQPDPTPNPQPQPQPPPPPPLPIPPGRYTIQGTIQVVPTGEAPQPSPSPSPDDSAGPPPPRVGRLYANLTYPEGSRPPAGYLDSLDRMLGPLDVELDAAPDIGLPPPWDNPVWSRARAAAGGPPCLIVTPVQYLIDDETSPVLGSLHLGLGGDDLTRVVRLVDSIRARSVATRPRGRRP